MFSRPRTPNENPFSESAFSAVKRAPEYPGQFLDDRQAVAYFERYFDWYNHQHYHSGIDYVTPHQAHAGLRGKIVARRLSQQRAQRLRRRAANQRQSDSKQTPNHNPTAVALVV